MNYCLSNFVEHEPMVKLVEIKRNVDSNYKSDIKIVFEFDKLMVK